MTYDIDYFIKKFEAIPEELWMTGKYTDGVRCCAFGHCGSRQDWDTTEESGALSTLFCHNGFRIADINDKTSTKFPQKTPKQRILAALYYIKNRII